jgi:hypothetical protein
MLGKISPTVNGLAERLRHGRSQAALATPCCLLLAWCADALATASRARKRLPLGLPPD